VARAARAAAAAAERATGEAAARAEEVARQAREAAAAAARAAEEAAAKAEAAIPASLVKKIISSWEFILFLVAVFLASVFAAVAISVGLSGLIP